MLWNNIELPDKNIYFQDEDTVIYCADCRDILPLIPAKSIDLVLTDPPYGVAGGKGRNRIRAKAKYSDAGFDDTDDYVRDICVPIIKQCIEKAQRVVVTSGNKNIQYYPRFTDIGGFYIPNSIGLSPWGIQSFQVILYYGKDPYPQKFKSACLLTNETSEANGHPCPKPTNAWSWLLARASLINDLILDPFLGSGTTLVCAKKLGRKAIGIEIEEKYCQIAVERLRQSVMRMDA